MNRISFALIAAAFLSSSAAQAQSVDAMADCKAFSANYLATYNKGDTAGVVAMYEKDATFSSPFWTAEGRDGLMQGFKAEMASGIKFTQIGCAHSSRTGALGYAEGPWAATTRGPDGKDMTVGGHYVVVVRLVRGKYLLQSHFNNLQLPPPGSPATH